MIRLLPALALSLAALPVLANPVSTGPTLQILPRDSDGIVISIIDVVDYFPGGPGSGGVVPGEVYYTLGGIEMDGLTGGEVMQGGTATLPPVVLGGEALTAALSGDTPLQIGTATFRVEALGGKVWLRDVATGQRYAALAHVAPMTPDAKGLSVNPEGFALD